jgi:hypothetical protein
VVKVDIFRACAQVAGQGQEAGMLARAVVVDLAGRRVRAQKRAAGFGVHRQMRAAAQVRLGQPQIAQPLGDHAGMQAGARMAGAGQRKLRIGQAGGIGGATFDQRQRLKHLARRPREDHRPRIAPGLDDPRGVADHRMAAVKAFGHSAAPEFDQVRRRHFPSLTFARNPANGGFPARRFRGISRKSS